MTYIPHYSFAIFRDFSGSVNHLRETIGDTIDAHELENLHGRLG
jgi:hypothetical protein